jgi:cysteinyl-tRNA synthetase
MSVKELGCETLDIHAGGLDLKFPHHENEIAQSEALTGKPFAKYWIHHGLLKINGQKMAKSLGNFITVEDALKKYKSANDLKMFFLMSHYRSAIDLSDEKIEEAHKNIQKIIILFERIRKIPGTDLIDRGDKEEFVYEFEGQFKKAMDDDFNTPQALSCIFDFIKELNRRADSGQDHEQALIVLKKICQEVFGLFQEEIFGEIAVGDMEESLPGDNELRKILEERKKARERKDFQRSDELRDELKEKGIVVEDGKGGQIWRWA